jgi:RNA polymerase sigma-70 factor (ECF subfamily)
MKSVLESAYRQESGRILAYLVGRCGSLELAEDALHDAFTTALTEWPRSGTPNNQGAWLTTVAYRKLLDRLRRESTRTAKQDEVSALFPGATEPEESAAPEIPDERLQLFFLCCHPALNTESQVALTLRTLGGLTTVEIAHAFLIPEATLAQRLVRAKHKIRDAGIPYDVPAAHLLRERLEAVRRVVYLIFNEGYAASGGDLLIRPELCVEAIRLGRVLLQLAPEDAEDGGLLALMLLQDSRREARLDGGGNLVPLEEQDRSRWDRVEIDEGLAVLDGALARRTPGPYQIQAAIAALHAEAPVPESTDWRQIAALYQELWKLDPTPVVALNAAVARGMAEGYEIGLKLVDALQSDLREFRFFHAARADLLRRLDRKEDALDAYRRALAMTANAVERRYLERRAAEMAR